jgi:hypothetical protein
MFIVWQGVGFMGLLVPVLFLVGGNALVDSMLGKGYSSAHGWSMALMIALSAAVVWFIGWKLNARPGRQLIDAQTQEVLTFKPKHTIFWIPLQYFAGILAAIALFILFKQ